MSKHDHALKKLKFDLLIPSLRVSGGGSVGKTFATMLLHFVIPVYLIWLWKSWNSTYWPNPQGRGVGGGGGREGVCGQTISYHVAVFFTLFHMICNMTRFWQIWILTFWPHSLSPPRWWDTGLGFKITFDMFHIYCTFVCMRSFSKKNLATYWVIAKFKYLTFDPTLGVRGVG